MIPLTSPSPRDTRHQRRKLCHTELQRPSISPILRKKEQNFLSSEIYPPAVGSLVVSSPLIPIRRLDSACSQNVPALVPPWAFSCGCTGRDRRRLQQVTLHLGISLSG